MASNPPRLKVSLAPFAKRDLNQIWFWNADHRHTEWADDYEAFLLEKIDELKAAYTDGRPVPLAKQYQYITARKSKGGHGHYVVYQVNGSTVEILRLLHTRRDWQNRLLKGED